MTYKQFASMFNPSGESEKTLGKHVFGRNILYVMRCFDLYDSFRQKAAREITKGVYLTELERRFLRAARLYLRAVKRKAGYGRNGRILPEDINLERKLEYIKQEVYETIKKTYPSHYEQLAKEFPDLLPKK